MAVVGRIAATARHPWPGHRESGDRFPEERFQPGAELFIERRRRDVEAAGRLTSVRFHRGRPVIGFEGVDDDRTSAASWRHSSCACRSTAGAAAAGDVLPARPGRLRGRDGGRRAGRRGRRRRRRRSGAAGWWCDGARGEVLIPLVAEICTIDRRRRQADRDRAAGRVCSS